MSPPPARPTSPLLPATEADLSVPADLPVSKDWIVWHDLKHDLSRRRLMLRQYEAFIANADGHEALRTFWKKMQVRERDIIIELQELIANHVQRDRF